MFHLLLICIAINNKEVDDAVLLQRDFQGCEVNVTTPGQGKLTVFGAKRVM